MERRVAVQVQYPRVSYVDLFPLDGRHRSRRRLSPIEVDQPVAAVKLFLMSGEGGSFVPERELHVFRIGGLPSGADRTPVLTLDAEYDGAQSVRLSISGAGIASQVADVRVPRSNRPRPSGWWWVAVPVILVLLGGGAFLTTRLLGVSTGSDTARSANTTSVGADQSSTDNAAGSPVETPSSADVDSSGTADEPTEDQPGATLPRSVVSVYFEPNRTRLTEAALRELDEVIPVLREHPEAPVSIVGHTALYGTEEGRIEISQGRAQGVAAYLQGNGWEPQTEPSVEWVGSQNPATREREDQQRNRRVEITIGGDQTSR